MSDRAARHERLKKLGSTDGFFLVCAVDHLTEFAELMPPVGGRAPSFTEIQDAKFDLINAISHVTSGYLIDAEYGAGLARVQHAVPADLGCAFSLENGDYSLSSPKNTVLREGWNVAGAKSSGGDAVKLLWWYRPDSPLAQSQREIAQNVVAQCAEVGLPLILEPIWYPLPGEDPESVEWKTRRAHGVIESGLLAQDLGADMVKLEFPWKRGSALPSEASDNNLDITAMLTEFGSNLHVPWVILSAGVGFDEFREQVDIASRSGACGYIAGRSLWREVVSASGPDRNDAIAEIVDRLTELNSIVRRAGQPI